MVPASANVAVSEKINPASDRLQQSQRRMDCRAAMTAVSQKLKESRVHRTVGGSRPPVNECGIQREISVRGHSQKFRNGRYHTRRGAALGK